MKRIKALVWPTWLYYLQDQIFEGLPVAEQGHWTEALTEAVPVGVELDAVKWRFCCFLLTENIVRVEALTLDNEIRRKVTGALRQCLTLHEQAVSSGTWNKSAAWSARSAWSAAWSARSAAQSVIESARSAARSAAWSARSAAWSTAWSAAWSAQSAAYMRYRDELLRLLKDLR